MIALHAILILWLALACLAPPPAAAAGLELSEPGAHAGYTLVAPMGDTTTYLIDIDGNLVHTWAGDHRPGLAAYLLEDGRLLRTAQDRGNTVFNSGGAGGRVQMVEWDGTISWDYAHYGSNYCSHHDVAFLPGGNILMIVWQYKTAEEARAAGRDPGLLSEGALWPDSIVEIRPTGANAGEVVWQWNVWDHLVQDHDPDQANYGPVADHPELIDLNYISGRAGADWTHINSGAYDADLDQILLSVRGFGEIWIIDHSTTTAEAAGHGGGRYGKGGDLLYRWGNPQAHEAGGAADQKLFAQHDAVWIDTASPGGGDILIFNNGQGRTDGDYSSVDQIIPPMAADGAYSHSARSAFGPVATAWSYTADPPSSMYANHISGSQRLANGNTLICLGPTGTLVEVTAAGDQVWRLVTPESGSGRMAGNSVFKARRYAPDYPGLAGRDLTPSGAWE